MAIQELLKTEILNLNILINLFRLKILDYILLNKDLKKNFLFECSNAILKNIYFEIIVITVAVKFIFFFFILIKVKISSHYKCLYFNIFLSYLK